VSASANELKPFLEFQLQADVALCFKVGLYKARQATSNICLPLKPVNM
jgi:hypothetical protein